MASPITWVLRLKIQDGKQEEFSAVMKEMVQNTESETGALVYDWFADGGTVHIVERYADSAAVVTHMQNFGPFAERFLGSIQPLEFTVYGEPSDSARESIAALAPAYLAPLASITR